MADEEQNGRHSKLLYCRGKRGKRGKTEATGNEAIIRVYTEQ
jgi:hypothetical protein